MPHVVKREYRRRLSIASSQVLRGENRGRRWNVFCENCTKVRTPQILVEGNSQKKTCIANDCELKFEFSLTKGFGDYTANTTLL